MAYTNFIPEIWSEQINRELERATVFVEDTNRQYEGEVKRKGDTVHILGIAKPTIRTMARANAGGGPSTTSPNPNKIAGPEVVDTTDTTLVVDEIRYFNYMVGDIDKAQAVKGIMDALNKETSEGLANEMDKFISNLHVGDGNSVLLDKSGTAVTKDNILLYLDEAIQKLYENDVSTSTDIVVTISPKFFTLFRQAYQLGTDENQGIYKNGKVGMFHGVTIKMSNNVYVDSDNHEHIQVKTKRAIAFVNPLTHTEAYRPDDDFADAVKGFELFGGKVVRPKEIVDLEVSYS